MSNTNNPGDSQTPVAEAGKDHVSITELPHIVTLLFQRAQRPLLPGAQQPIGLFVRYLRRKPQRGLAVIYNVDELRKGGADGHTSTPDRSVSLTLDEIALDGAHIRFNTHQAQAAPLEVQASGVLRVEEIGLAVQAYPADASLPTLSASSDTSRGSQLFHALEQAARAYLRDETWELREAEAIPVRYKPGNRCVIRYALTLEQGTAERTQRHLTIFGKVYANPVQAASTQDLMQRLYNEQARFQGQTLVGITQNAPLLPEPLGTVTELGLTLNEAVQPADPAEHLLTGPRALRPELTRGKGGEVTAVIPPEEKLRLTAAALARLHTSAVKPAESAPRTGAKEAKRARERAALIAKHLREHTHGHAQADETSRLAQELATRLETLTPDSYRPAHGGFKASQLLFHSHAVFVVDFDGFCLADPALDVGYFLAYLRPSGLWYERQGMREWFEQAAAIFRSTYQAAMRELEVTESELEGILTRSRLYEAALLYKIATRRVNRLNSPRPKELSAMLREIEDRLAR